MDKVKGNGQRSKAKDVPSNRKVGVVMRRMDYYDRLSFGPVRAWIWSLALVGFVAFAPALVEMLVEVLWYD